MTSPRARCCSALPTCHPEQLDGPAGGLLGPWSHPYTSGPAQPYLLRAGLDLYAVDCAQRRAVLDPAGYFNGAEPPTLAELWRARVELLGALTLTAQTPMS